MRRAKPSRCPNAFTPLHAYSLSTGKSYKIPCGKWSCSYCGWQKKNIAQYLVLAGAVSHFNAGERIRFATFTEDPKNPLDVPALSAAWNRLRTNYRKQGIISEYAATIETTSAGRPHLHALMTGSYVKQWKLSAAAERAGFGRVADIRAVDMSPGATGEHSVAYICKELAGYVSKQNTSDELGKLTRKRRRPLRCSRGWYPGGMARAREELAALWLEDEDGDDRRDRGEWLFVIGDPSGTLTIRGKDEDGQPFAFRDLEMFGGDLVEQGGRRTSERKRSEDEGRRRDDQGNAGSLAA